jgi:hypothetical protein
MSNYLMKKVIYLLTIVLLTCPQLLAAKDYEKQFLSCSGYRKIGENYFNEKESLLLQITGNRPKSYIDRGKNFGTLKFSKSKALWSDNSILRLCDEDELKYRLEPICIFDKEHWPENISEINRDCTLDKVTGKFYCHIGISYNDKTPYDDYTWDYECKVTKPLLK